MSENVIGQRIVKLRKEAGEKQEDLALLLNCNRGSVANYEAGKRVPDITSLMKIAEHYDTTVDYLVGYSDTASRNIELKSICDYLGLEEASIRKIKELFSENDWMNHIPLDSALLQTGREKFPQYFKEVLNRLLRSDAFFDIVGRYANEMTLAYLINVIEDTDTQMLEGKTLEDYYELYNIARTIERYDERHHLNLFTIQNYSVAYARMLTNIDQINGIEIYHKTKIIREVLRNIEPKICELIEKPIPIYADAKYMPDDEE